MKLFCYIGWHSYGEVTHRPCERFKTCDLCGKEKVYIGWHCFEKSGDVYYVNITETYGGDEVNHYIESKQKRICKDCKLMDVVTLK